MDLRKKLVRSDQRAYKAACLIVAGILVMPVGIYFVWEATTTLFEGRYAHDIEGEDMTALVGSAGAGLGDAERWSSIEQVWQLRKKDIAGQLHAMLELDNPNYLYHVQGFLHSLLYAAADADEPKYAILDDIAELLLIPLEYLDEVDMYQVPFYHDQQKRDPVAVPLDESRRMWLDEDGVEDVMSSQQYLYLVAAALKEFGELPRSEWTPNMHEVAEEYPSLIEEHLTRWIYESPGAFQLKGRACRIEERTITRPTLTWEEVAGADHYRLWIEEFPSGNIVYYHPELRQTFLTVPASIPVQNFDGLEEGKTYTWWVQAEDKERNVLAGPMQGQGLSVLPWTAQNGQVRHLPRRVTFTGQEMAEHLYHEKFVPHPARPDVTYCNVLTAFEYLLAGGVAEFLAASEIDSTTVKLSAATKAQYRAYLDTVSALLKKRTKSNTLRDWQGNVVKVYMVDPGGWSTYPEYVYAGYTGSTFPGPSDQQIVPGVGLDISHGRQLMLVFDSLHRLRSYTDQEFPDREIMEGLANQFAYRVFNRNFDFPLFTNYMDGTNGWYRVNYAGQDGFGYAPYRLSAAALFGGYGRYGVYNDDINRIMDAVWKMVNSKNSATITFRTNYYEIREHVDHMQSARYSVTPTWSFDALNFLSSYRADDQ